MSQATPGWYPDPNQPDALRYWDGRSWTEHRAVTAPSTPPVPPPPGGYTATGAPGAGAGSFPGVPHPGVPYPYGLHPVQADAANTLSIIAIVCGAIAFLFLPIVFGPAGIVLAAIGRSKKEKLAPVALGVAIAGTVIGILLGIMLVM